MGYRSVLFGEYDTPELLMGHQLSDFNFKCKRAGCIFYAFIKKELWICMGRDTDSGDLTDFGGTKKEKETIFQCAAREANEESLGAFTTIKSEDIMNNWILYNKYMMICFLPLVSDNIIVDSISAFNSTYYKQQNVKKEVSELVWLRYDEFRKSLGFTPTPGYKIYDKVYRFLCSSFNENGKSNQSVNDYLLSLQQEKSSSNRATQFAKRISRDWGNAGRSPQNTPVVSV